MLTRDTFIAEIAHYKYTFLKSFPFVDGVRLCGWCMDESNKFN